MTMKDGTQDFCGGRIVLYLDCGGGYMNYMCVKPLRTVLKNLCL